MPNSIRRRLSMGLCLSVVLTAATTAGAQQAQNPSPMSDTTRPHPPCAILSEPANVARVSTVILLDSLHASYAVEGDPAAPRSKDPAVKVADLDVFTRLAAEAATGRKRFWVTHSEVYPGTYASTTDTANALLASLNLSRRPVLKQGPLGMQQLSEAHRGGFLVLGFAGNSAPDHVDHLYALGDWMRKWKVVR